MRDDRDREDRTSVFSGVDKDRPDDTGLAVTDATRLNMCFNQLARRLAASPDLELPYGVDVKVLPRTGRRLPKGTGKIALDVNRRLEAEELASLKLANLVAEGMLQLWVHVESGENMVDHASVGQISHATLATGRLVSKNGQSLLDGAPLWVKCADWDEALKYRLGLSSLTTPKRPTGRPNARDEAIAIHRERIESGTTAMTHKREAEEIFDILVQRHKREPEIKALSIARALREWRREKRINSEEK